MRATFSALSEQSIHLLRRVKEGDGRAFDRLFGRTREGLLSVIRRRLGGEMRWKVESMDVLQDVWADALGDIGTFQHRGPGSFLRWLSARVENKIRGLYDRFHARRRDMRAEVPLAGEPSSLFPFPQDPTPSALSLSHERSLLLKKAVDNLEDEARQVFFLRLYEDLPFKEIGRRRNKSEDAVRMIYARALLRISARLGEM